MLHDVPEKPEAAAVERRHESPESDSSGEPGEETEEEKARRLLYCSLCKVAVNSASQLEAHNVGEEACDLRPGARSSLLKANNTNLK